MNPPNPKPLISRRRIQKRTAELGCEISGYYQGKPLLVAAICNGALLFAADLIRNITVPMQFDTLAVESYIGEQSSGEIRFRSQPKLDPAGTSLTALRPQAGASAILERLTREVCTYHLPLAEVVSELTDRPVGDARALID